MYGIVSIIFVMVLGGVYYKISTRVDEPYLGREVGMGRILVTGEMEVFAACVDKQELGERAFVDMRIRSNYPLSFAITFDSNPLLTCQ